MRNTGEDHKMFIRAQSFADWLIYEVFNVQEGSRLGSAANFFVFDSIKIFSCC